MNSRELEEKERLVRENEYYRRRYEELEKQWDRVRKIRHDMQNLYVLELEYLKAGQYQLLMEHYQKQLKALDYQERMNYTGNVGIDSILHYKAMSAQNAGVVMQIEAKRKGEITIDPSDMNVILGNLLDNAIEAARKVPFAKRKIAVVIKGDAAALFLQVCNCYMGKRRKGKEGKYMTNKDNKEYHGIGLQTVESMVEKYKGSMQIAEKNGIFSVKFFLYL